jgi:hydrogenase maturation protein HypF
LKSSITTLKPKEAKFILLTGRVQGVGMRPFIYRLAKKNRLSGCVFNRPDGVAIHVEGDTDSLEEFLAQLSETAPMAASIKNIVVTETEVKNYPEFEIQQSRDTEKLITEICPDIAVCPDCLNELMNSARRTRYPFINCTNCGPRFTLINDFPYDRAKTTMHEFEMCDDCRSEYTDPADRRFHAQPTSCNNCGPHYTYNDHGSELTINYLLIQKAVRDIDLGKVIAIKGLGGYNLACDAFHSDAVDEIRRFKNREKKPFAVMFKSVNDIQLLATCSQAEIQTLHSWQRPIVIVNLREEAEIPSGITSNLKTIGIFLPYLPLHYLLFDNLSTNALVLTSGNESDTPILMDDKEALKTFETISGGILSNNRRIAHRNDDSVVRIINSEPRLMRRARGYVPTPVDLSFDADGILATGAELSNCFCIGKGLQALMSQHIGDLKNAETYSFYCDNIEEFSRLYRFTPHTVVCDLHPDYLSTCYAHQSNLPVVQVQHHHAHIAACMAEFQINEPVIGLSYDGTGYGTDGTIWGSEVMVADLSEFKRISHFENIPLPGGDTAVKETWRSAISYLYKSFGSDWIKAGIPLLKEIDVLKAVKITEAIDKKINSPLCCSAGRLFDAVAALLGICLESNYHAEAPLLMENYLDNKFTGSYPFSGNQQISFVPAITGIVANIIEKKPVQQIVTQFHNTVAAVAQYQIMFALKKYPLKKIIISGGTFQNKYLAEKLINLLADSELEIFFPREIPCNDGGIALGQLTIAANKK